MTLFEKIRIYRNADHCFRVHGGFADIKMIDRKTFKEQDLKEYTYKFVTGLFIYSDDGKVITIPEMDGFMYDVHLSDIVDITIYGKSHNVKVQEAHRIKQTLAVLHEYIRSRHDDL